MSKEARHIQLAFAVVKRTVWHCASKEEQQSGDLKAPTRHATEEGLNPLERQLKLYLMMGHDWKRSYWHWELASEQGPCSY